VTTPTIDGLNRTQRRQMARAQGWRGSKAKRQFPNRGAHRNATAEAIAAQQLAAAQAQADAQAQHERRQDARRAGLIMPPTPEEMAHLKARGKIDHDPRLLLPGD
jgi:hypothetical protein